MLHILKKNKINQKQISENDYKNRLNYLQSRLEKVRQQFDMETDSENIESLIYEEKALIIRIDHLIKSYKKQNKNAASI